MIEFAALGTTDSFVNNLIASANACNIPAIPTIFGPLRLCIAAKTFRSNNVKKATINISGKIIGNVLIKSHSIKSKINITGILIRNKLVFNKYIVIFILKTIYLLIWFIFII
jgi:hypothetical protein